MWCRNRRFQRVAGRSGWLATLIRLASSLELLSLGGHKDTEIVNLIRRNARDRQCLLTANEAYLIHSLAHAQAKLPGHMAEVGVYQGGSARLMCAAKGEKSLLLFDTFDGLPEPTEFERDVHVAHQFRSDYESVRSYLAGFANVHFLRGKFPESGESVRELKFCFVHLDVDLYQSTLDCLNFFYPRMVEGGIILSHDYSLLDGVRRAFQEFLADKRETAIELPSTQCMIWRLPTSF